MLENQCQRCCDIGNRPSEHRACNKVPANTRFCRLEFQPQVNDRIKRFNAIKPLFLQLDMNLGSPNWTFFYGKAPARLTQRWLDDGNKPAPIRPRACIPHRAAVFRLLHRAQLPQHRAAGFSPDRHCSAPPRCWQRRGMPMHCGDNRYGRCCPPKHRWYR
jgi:hypothetical protein